MINGSSSIWSGDLIAGATWSEIARRRIYPWFDRVASKYNPVDALSRGDASGDWDLVKLKFPDIVKRECRKLLKDILGGGTDVGEKAKRNKSSSHDYMAQTNGVSPAVEVYRAIHETVIAERRSGLTSYNETHRKTPCL